MDARKVLRWVSVALIAVFALSGCGQANARDSKTDKPRPTAAAVGAEDAHPSADADSDRGPGCAESALTGESHQQTRKSSGKK